MSRRRWPESTNSVSEKPGTIQGPPLNYFIYPYVEVDGQPFDHVDHRFRFQDVVSTSESETAVRGF